MENYNKLLNDLESKTKRETAYLFYINKNFHIWLFTLYSNVKQLKTIYLKEIDSEYYIDISKIQFTYNLIPVFIIYQKINHNIIIKSEKMIKALKQKLKEIK